MLGIGGGNKKGYGPIGVAVSATDVRLAQCTPNRGYLLECESLSQEVDPSGPAYHTETSRAIATAIRRGKFVGKDVVSALPVEMLRYKTLRMPPMPPEEMVQAVAWEAADRLSLNDGHALQHYAAGEVSQGNEQREEIILLAIPKQDVHDHASAVKRAGLEPSAIDATGAALGRLLGQDTRSSMIIHLGKHVAEIIGVRGRRIIFDKPVQFNGEGDAMDIQSVARELGLCLRYLSVTFGVHKPDRAWLCGEGVTHDLAQGLGDSLHIPLRAVDLAPAFETINSVPEEAAKWAVAMGLAKRNEHAGSQRGAA